MAKPGRGGKIGSFVKLSKNKMENIVEKFGFVRGEVQNEYLANATPGIGSLTYDKECIKEPEKYDEEIEIAKWLYDTFGGDVRVLEEKKKLNTPDPDFLWNNKLWDLKTITTEKAANTAIERGHKQIKSNPGGVILDLGNNRYKYNKLVETIDNRMKWYYGQSDILIISKKKLVKILRYKK